MSGLSEISIKFQLSTPILRLIDVSITSFFPSSTFTDVDRTRVRRSGEKINSAQRTLIGCQKMRCHFLSTGKTIINAESLEQTNFKNVYVKCSLSEFFSPIWNDWYDFLLFLLYLCVLNSFNVWRTIRDVYTRENNVHQISLK